MLCLRALALVILMSVSASAQNIHVYSIFTKHGEVPAFCQKQVTTLETVLSEYQHPTNWTFTVVCDEPSWQNAVRTIGSVLPADHLRGITDQKARITLLRGSLFDQRPGGEATIVHELVHIALRSHDDFEVERVAAQWIKDRKRAKAVNVSTLLK